jgi:hypothetical protein
MAERSAASLRWQCTIAARSTRAPPRAEEASRMTADRPDDVIADTAPTDDWAPLPGASVSERPGAAADVKKCAPRPAASAAAASHGPAPAPATSAPDPAAERALAALKAKIERSGPAKSLIADVLHREQRAARKTDPRRAARVAGTVVTAAPPAVEIAIDERASDADPRELEPWFRELPQAEQARLRAQWWSVRHRDDGAGRTLQRRLRRALGYGALTFFVLGVLLSVLEGSLDRVPVWTAAGAIAGGLAEVLGGGRFVWGFAGAAAYTIVVGPSALVNPFALMTLPIAAYGMGAIGMDAEMRRSGGFREG